jgi:predicted RND superfamily exporter protein
MSLDKPIMILPFLLATNWNGGSMARRDIPMNEIMETI